MNRTSTVSNVYYLAASTPALACPPRLPLSLTLRLRIISFYYRLRMTAAEIADVLCRFGRPMGEPDTVFLEQRAEIILAGGSPRTLGPARVIDLAAARARLRA
jgi:hypothetical protein